MDVKYRQEAKQMSTRSQRIKLLIEQSGKSYQELEKTTGIKKSSLQRYATGVTAKIPLDVIEKLSKAFNVSKEYLMGWSETQILDLDLQAFAQQQSPDKVELTEGEQMVLDLFRKIPEERQPEALELLRVALRMQKKL
jgi:transcriptional regulator with XRE-family HTH domain